MSNSRSDAQSYLKQAQAYIFSESPDYAAAEKSLRQAIILAADWGEPFHFLGFALQQQGKLAEAIEAFQAAIKLLPADPRPIIGLGSLMLTQDDHAKAALLLEEGIALKPHYAEADAILMLAQAYEGLGQIKKAEVLWHKVMAMDNDYPSYDWPKNEARKKLAEHGLLPTGE